MAYDFTKRYRDEEIDAAESRKRAAEAAVSQLGNFNYGRQADYNRALDAVLGRDKFKYDVNRDELYKQVRQNYANLGKIAMQDTIGQASAMTGGYGNSYAVTAGQQAYNQHMQKAQDSIPELYQMAFDRYNAEGNRLAANLGVLSDDRNREYGEWSDRYNRLANEREYANNEYQNVYNAAYQLAKSKAAASGNTSKSGGESSGGNKSKSSVLKTFDQLPKAIRSEAVEALSAGGTNGLNEFLNKLADLGWDEEQIDVIAKELLG